MTQQRSILTTPLVLLVLMSATVSQAVVSPEACMINGFVLPDVPECTFGALSEAFARVFQEAQDIGMTCPHDAATELQYLLGATDADNADAILKETVCQPGFDNYENKLPFEVIAGKGTDFDENYYQGGSTFNEQRATLYNRYDEQVDDELYLLKEDAAHIDSFYDAQGRYGMVEFPSDHVSSLSTCEHNAMYCCWPQDRQANDNNGNCDDPYDTDCVDSDPADNTDLCYAKTAEGFLAFPGEDGNGENNAERSIHCHGTAWANPETADTSWAFRGNNLFYISMYDHLYQRGYVRNIEGHPMCGCIEDMPVASRSDCTEMDVDLELDFKFDGFSWTMELQTMAIAFNACQGINRNGKEDNNDLWAYANRLHMEGLYDYDDMLVMTSQLVGDQPDDQICRDAEEKMLHERGYALGYSHNETTRIPLVGKGFVKAPAESDMFFGPASQAEMLTNTTLYSEASLPILEYVCANCYISHQHIFYKRLTAVTDPSTLVDSLANSNSQAYGLFNQDFELYSTLEDAVAGENKWACPNNAYNYGSRFPGECSPNGDRVRNQNIRFRSGSSRTHGAWYLVGSVPYERLESFNIGGFAGNHPGSAFTALDGGVHVTTATNDIWDTHDQMQFVPQGVAKPNFDMVVKIEEFHGRDSWAKAGLMIRESDAPDAKNFFLHVSFANGMRLQTRKITGGSTASDGRTPGAGLAAPIWLKVTKTSNEFIGYTSPDGTTWTQFHIPHYIDMDPSTMIAGMAVSAHETDGRVAEAIFTGFVTSRIEVAGNYQTASNAVDIGDAVNAVGLSESDETSVPGSALYRISGSGSRIHRQSDHFRFTHFPASGDFMIEAQVAEINPSPSDWTLAGIMIRNDLTSESANALIGMTIKNGVLTQYRETAGENTVSESRTGGPIDSVFLRLTRVGSVVYWERSMDGASWTMNYMHDFGTLLNDSVQVGMAVTSSANRVRATAVFQDWKYTALTSGQFVPRSGAMSTISSSVNVGGYRGGAPGVAFTDAEGDIHLASTGYNVEKTSDSFQFIDETIPDTNFEISVQVKAFNFDDQNALAGIMIRESMEPDAKTLFLAVRGATGQVREVYRSGTGVNVRSSGWSSETITQAAPVWLKISKNLNEYYCFISTDGVTWEQFRTPLYMNFDESTMVAGLAATSRHGNGNAVEATFGSLSTAVVEPVNPGYVRLTPDRSVDIGNAQSQPGYAEQDPSGNKYSISASGSDIWGSSDHFHFVHETTSGDFILEVDVTGIPRNQHTWTKAGIMIRESLDSASPNVFNFLALARGAVGAIRPESAADTLNVPRSHSNHPTDSVSLRLTKVGTTITWERMIPGVDEDYYVYAMQEGVTWAEGDVIVGMAVTSHDQRARATATFENYSVTPISSSQYVKLNGSPSTMTSSTNIGGYRGGGPGAAFVDSAGTLHMTSSAYEIGGEADETQMHEVPIPSDDFEITAYISEFDSVNGESSTGLMLRESDGAGSKHVFFQLRGRDQLRILYRASTDSSTHRQGEHVALDSEAAPIWLRIRKFQNAILFFTSTDGSTFEPFDKELVMNIAPTMAGVVLTSRDNNGWLANVAVPSLSISEYVEDTPYNFNKVTAASDFGNAANIPGYSEVDGTTYRIKAAGSDIWSAEDHFHFVYFDASGNFEIEALVDNVDPIPDDWTKAGVMIRNKLESSSVNYFSYLAPQKGARGQMRSEFGQNSVSFGPYDGQTASASVKLRRVDGVVTFSRKLIGGDWEDLREEAWPGEDAVFVGMALTSHNHRARATAIFKDWKLTQL